jgi:hypothetical protein
MLKLNKLLMAACTNVRWIQILKAHNISISLDKSVKWVYKHAEDLGGVKIGGSWFFTEEGLRDALQRRSKVARKGHDQRKTLHLLKGDQRRSKRMGGRPKEGGIEGRAKAATRHGLDEFLH